jgi:hypothetical protein
MSVLASFFLCILFCLWYNGYGLQAGLNERNYTEVGNYTANYTKIIQA